MSDGLAAVRLRGVGKMYKVFGSRRERMLDALGFGRVLPSSWIKPRMFWSLREVDLEIPKGGRIGFIGRNGAGKSTLLKLINRTIAPTEGTIEVRGQVQALFETGAGFHPEFTGYDNIRAALTYQGLSHAQIEAAVADIADFTELDDFLGQPFKTYSMGMQARLTFATATAVKPDILIVDEVLGVGDAYFLSKSAERMRKLVEDTQATVLIVSHALDQVLRYCDECIWLERGRVQKRGPTLDVINAYEEFIHELEDKRLRGKNRLPRGSGADVKDVFDRIAVRFEWSSPAGARCAINEVKLVRDGESVEKVAVGDAQDADLTHFASVILAGQDWSEPIRQDGVFSRELAGRGNGDGGRGQALFRAPGALEQGEYALGVRFRRGGQGTLAAQVLHNGNMVVQKIEAPTGGDAWAEWSIALGRFPKDGPEQKDPKPADDKRLYRWASEGSLRIAHVMLTDPANKPRAVFPVGTPLKLSFDVRAERDGSFNLVSGVSIYRVDGVFISNLISPEMPMSLKAGEMRRIELLLDHLNFGNGTYVSSISIFEKAVSQESRYDLIARTLEFSVVGNGPLQASAVFDHPARWSST
jgi:lipopolysaccharide transport system ATP-binding protein